MGPAILDRDDSNEFDIGTRDTGTANAHEGTFGGKNLVAYFAHDWADAAIKRRVAAYDRDRMSVAGFAMHRKISDMPEWVVADLGQTADNAYFGRIDSVISGARTAQKHKQTLSKANVIVARNLDMLLIALLARKWAGLRTPVIYECLDIHRFLVREDVVGTAFRKIEGWALKQCAGLWVSSPAFLKEYFHPVHGELPATHLLENRFQAAPGDRPKIKNTPQKGAVLRIGWFGNLRCERSLSLLEEIGTRFGDQVEIVLRGYPAEAEIPDFRERVQTNQVIRFGGRYQWPGELKDIYENVDIVWAGDFMDAGKNSQWLMPNRIYEGGWYGCPPIAPAACETGRWIAERKCGFTISEPIEETLPNLIDSLLNDPRQIHSARETLLDLPDSTFIEPENTLENAIRSAIQPGELQTV